MKTNNINKSEKANLNIINNKNINNNDFNINDLDSDKMDDNNELEIWKYIVGFNNNYQISNLGRIRSSKSKKIMKQYKDKEKYIISLSKKDGGKKYNIHILVAKHFVKTTDTIKNNHVYHIDNDKLNNISSNLKWVSKREYNRLNNIDADDIELKQNEVFINIGTLDNKDFSSYEISNYGRIKNVITKKLLNPFISQTFYTINLRDIDGERHSYRIHYLVAKYHIPNNDDNKKAIRYIDGDKLNNHYTNLEWISRKDTVGARFSKKIYKLDINTGKILDTYDSATDALIKLGKSTRSMCIYDCCYGKQKTYMGYKWCYEKDYANFKNDVNIIEEIDGEIWKDIEDCESRYQISNMGRVKSKSQNKIMSGINRKGYLSVKLINNDTKIKKKLLPIHRLVALHFVENKDKKEIVDHIDGNKINNKVTNLRWVTLSENSLAYHELKKEKEKKEGKKIIVKGKIVYNDDEVFENIGTIGNLDYSNYEVSNYGKIRNVLTNKLLEPALGDNEYYTICLGATNGRKTFYVHRLVAKLFVDNSDEENDIVNHLDENKLNNYYKNLEWTTIRGNNIYSVGKKIHKIDIHTDEILKTYNSMAEAAEDCKVKHCTCLTRCCMGKRKTAYGYKWKYAE